MKYFLLFLILIGILYKYYQKKKRFYDLKRRIIGLNKKNYRAFKNI